MKKLQKKVYQYTVIFERNERDGFTVTVPSLPGLVTEGDTLNDARDMAADAIRVYIQGLKKTRETIPHEREIGQFKLAVTV